MSKAKKYDILIFGAGLTGLTLAYLLRDSRFKIGILEARDRIGGRVHTLYPAGEAAQEAGATWLGKKHTALLDLLTELKLEIFPQLTSDRAVYEPFSTQPPQVVTLPPNDAPSYRIRGGSSMLINTLFENLENAEVMTGQRVVSVEKRASDFLVKTDTGSYTSRKVVSTLPPYLLLKTVGFSPALPANLQASAQQTHTWMGESIKVSLTYAEPFWRAENTSGTIVSNVGPVSEMYDHADFADENFALKGFINGAYFSLQKEERLAMILRQLEKYYGAVVRDYLTYNETVWRKESFTFAPYETHVLPHENNGHALYRQPLYDGDFYLAGAETAAAFPGYMDGAVRSARHVAAQILKS